MSAAITGKASSPGFREVELSVRGMTCAACAARVEKKLSALDDVTASVNFATGRATVTAPASVPGCAAGRGGRAGRLRRGTGAAAGGRGRAG